MPRTAAQSMPKSPDAILGMAREFSRSSDTIRARRRKQRCSAILSGRRRRVGLSSPSCVIRFRTWERSAASHNQISPGSGFVSLPQACIGLNHGEESRCQRASHTSSHRITRRHFMNNDLRPSQHDVAFNFINHSPFLFSRPSAWIISRF
jgi:hypothetical protein